MVVLTLDPRHDSVELRDGLVNSAVVLREAHIRVAAVFTRVVQVHAADLLSGAFFYEMRVDLELVLVLAQPIAILLHIRLSLRLKVDDLDGVALAPDQVDAALQDVLFFDKRNLDFGFLDAVPISILALVITHYVEQRGML